MIPAPPLHGLVLAGGQSRRMQQDKALLAYRDRNQVQVGCELLAPHVATVFISARANQWPHPPAPGYEILPDQFADVGPLGGILTALRCHPAAAWLVIACDLPFLDAATLERLVSQRDPRRLATAYDNPHDGLPDPLCTIYEPGAQAMIAAELKSGRRSPRAILQQANVQRLALENPRALDSVNSPAAYAAAKARLSPDPH